MCIRDSAETVMIPDADRRTACVSSQVGCPVGCRFCASGMNGVKGNLSAAQIVEQVFQLNVMMGAGGDEATKRRSDGGDGGDGGERQGEGAVVSSPSSLSPTITNIVFMGMGEPLSN